MAYATTTALSNETKARTAADSTEAKTRATAVTQINGRLDELEARIAALEPETSPVTPPVEPPPVTPPPTTRPFPDLSLPKSGPLMFDSATDVVVSPRLFQGIKFPDAAFTFSHCKGTLTIVGCDFDTLDWDVLDILNDSDITTIDFYGCRFRNIGTMTVAQYEAAGARAGADFIQLDHSVVGGRVHDNVLYGAHNEDLVSIQAGSGGQSATNPFIVEDNRFASPLPPDPLAWLSTSGSCGMVEGAQHVIFRRNTYLNMAQGGLGYNGGTDIHYTDNTIYAAQRVNGNVGLYTLVVPPSGALEMARNRVYVINAAGQHNPASLAGGVQPVGWATNVLDDTTIDPASLVVVL